MKNGNRIFPGNNPDAHTQVPEDPEGDALQRTIQSSSVATNDGTVQLKFNDASDGNYYITVRHRNSFETWSANPIALSSLTPANYNLSSSSSQAFGNNIIQVDASPFRYANYSGHVNQDGAIDLNDVLQTYGYVVSDLTGDNLTRSYGCHSCL